MNALTSNTIFLTKAARIYLANKETYAVSAGVMRSHSFESGAKAARNALICGIPSMATPAISKKYNIARPTYIVNAQHLFITSFVDELTAFRTLAKYFPDTCSFMIDTYGLENGVANAITIAKELRKKGHELVSVTVDSGDLAEGTRFVRKRLDKAGFKNVKIIIAGNLDEYKLKKLVEKKVPCDIVVIATEYITVADAPKLETIYKLSELRDKESVVYAAKFAPGKHHYPGVKQVYRKFKNKIMTEDIIGLENEKLGTPLLIKVMDKGKTCYDLPNIEQIKAYFIKQTKQLPNNLKNIDKLAEYKVAHSQKLEKLFNKVREERTK